MTTQAKSFKVQQNFFDNEKSYRKEKKKRYISEYCEGKSSLQAIKVALWLMIFSLGLILIISRLYFPTFYSMKIHFISTLGRYDRNPQGAYVFSVGLILVGIQQFLLTVNLSNILNTEEPKLAKVSKFFGIIGALGYIIVGLFPSTTIIPHLVGAVMVFFGFYLVLNLYWIRNSQQSRRNKKILKKKRYLGLWYVVFNLIALQFFITILIDIFIPFNNINEYTFFSSSLWEWIYFFSILIGTKICIYDISKSKFDKKKRKYDMEKKNYQPNILSMKKKENFVSS